MSEERFWRLTPAQLGALSERFRRNERSQDYRNGVVAAIAETACGAQKFDPFRHFPWQRESTHRAAPQMQQAATLKANLKAYQAYYESEKPKVVKSG